MQAPTRPAAFVARCCGRRSRITALLVAALLLSVIAEPAVQQRPRFEATVARVRVDVIVTDGTGRFIDDLRPEDFMLFEDGEEQGILDFQLVDLVAGTVASPAVGSSVSSISMRAAPEAPSATTNAARDLGAMVFID